MMSEDFLHYIWKLKLFNQLDLTTTDGSVLDVLKVGLHNTDAGPDFSNAQIKLNDTRWAGNVEIHIKSSDWIKHNHQNDKAYDNVILHVVYENDLSIKRASGEEIPTIELKNKVDAKVIDNYTKFQITKDWIPCANQLGDASSMTVNGMLDRMVLERLERKSLAIVNQLKLNHNNWEETFYQQLARNFGFKTNAEPFELLAKSLPINILAKHKNSLFQIEALLFGQAGMLEDHFEDEYLQNLQNEYAFLRKKYKLNPIEWHLWKFMRLRPMNFPTIRIAQFANLIEQSANLFSKIMELETSNSLNQLMDVSVSSYWRAHYSLGKLSKETSKDLGASSINNIVINTVIPFLFVYGKQKNEEKYCERALFFAENTAPETNKIIKQWKGLKMPVRNAYASQGLLQLKNEYCSLRKCLNCAIGNELLKNA